MRPFGNRSSFTAAHPDVVALTSIAIPLQYMQHENTLFNLDMSITRANQVDHLSIKKIGKPSKNSTFYTPNTLCNQAIRCIQKLGVLNFLKMKNAIYL